MFKRFALAFCAGAVVFATIAASVGGGNYLLSQRDIWINNQTNSVGLTITKGGNIHSNFVECYTGSVLSFWISTNGVSSTFAAVATNAFANNMTVTNTVTTSNLTATASILDSGLTASLPVFSDGSKVLVSKSIANTLLALGIQRGSNYIANDFSVTNTFGTAFSAIPVVVVGSSVTNALPAVTSITTSNCIFLANKTNTTFYWTAIGTP